MRVVAMTRFGGYATLALSATYGVFEIPEGFGAAAATALATQYVTAWYAGVELVRLHPGDRVLVQGAAGGVGTALVQIARLYGCVIFGTTGTPGKVNHLAEIGVDVPLCTLGSGFDAEYRRVSGGKSLDVIFDSLGGAGVRKGLRLLGSGGRLVSYGVVDMVGSQHTFPSSVRTLLAFGFPHPLVLLLHSKSLLGINMLRIADDRPDIIGRCLAEVVPGVCAVNSAPLSEGCFRRENSPRHMNGCEGGSPRGRSPLHGETAPYTLRGKRSSPCPHMGDDARKLR